MSKKMSGVQKLTAVLQHQQLRRAKPAFASVNELCRHYGITGEYLSQWHQQLVDRAEEIFADKRCFRKQASYEAEIDALKVRIEQLERERLQEFDDD